MKWLGYPVFEFTWEPALYLANAPDILHYYTSFVSQRAALSLLMVLISNYNQIYLKIFFSVILFLLKSDRYA